MESAKHDNIVGLLCFWHNNNLRTINLIIVAETWNVSIGVEDAHKLPSNYPSLEMYFTDKERFPYFILFYFFGFVFFWESGSFSHRHSMLICGMPSAWRLFNLLIFSYELSQSHIHIIYIWGIFSDLSLICSRNLIKSITANS